jgi:hypothetical protein
MDPVQFADQTYDSKFSNVVASSTLYRHLRPGSFAGNVYYSSCIIGVASDRID